MQEGLVLVGHAAWLLEELVVDPQDIIGTKACSYLSQIYMQLVASLVSLAAEEFCAHAEQDRLALIRNTSVVSRQIAHGSASLSHDVKHDVLLVIAFLRIIFGGGCHEIYPLENFTSGKISQLPCLINFDIAGALAHVRLDVGDGTVEPPLYLIFTSHQLVHLWLLLINSNLV